MAEMDNRPNATVTFEGKVTLELPQEWGNKVEWRDQDITDRLWALAGAFDGSTLKVERETVRTDAGDVDAIALSVEHPFLESPMKRLLLEEEGEGTVGVVENVEFFLKEEYRDQGIGRASLQRQAIAAFDLGFAYIMALAAGYAGHPKKYVGYKVWPRLGYDAEVPADLLAKMPREELRAAGLDPAGPLRISQLWDAGVYALWEQFGAGCIMYLYVRPLDGWSMRRLLDVPEE